MVTLYMAIVHTNQSLKRVFQKEVKTINFREIFRVLSSIQWSLTELLWVVRGMQQMPMNLSMVMTQVGVISLVPRLSPLQGG